MAEVLKNNMEYILLLVGAILGVMFMKQNVLGVNGRLQRLLPGSMNTTNIIGQILAAVLLGFVGYKIGSNIKTGGKGLFHADTYETFDRLLPDDYYGMGGRMASPIDFSNAPPPAV